MKRSKTDYTLEFRQEVVRLVRSGQRQADVAASLGMAGQTLNNWLKADAAGRVSGVGTIKPVSVGQMEISTQIAPRAHLRRRWMAPARRRLAGPPQHHLVAAATLCPRTQRHGKRLGLPARQQPQESCLGQLRRHRSSMQGRMELPRGQRWLGCSLQRFGSVRWTACRLICTFCRCRGAAQGGCRPTEAAPRQRRQSHAATLCGRWSR